MTQNGSAFDQLIEAGGKIVKKLEFKNQNKKYYKLEIKLINKGNWRAVYTLFRNLKENT